MQKLINQVTLHRLSFLILGRRADAVDSFTWDQHSRMRREKHSPFYEILVNAFIIMIITMIVAMIKTTNIHFFELRFKN